MPEMTAAATTPVAPTQLPPQLPLLFPRDLPEESATRRQVEARDAEINARRRPEGAEVSSTTKLYMRLVKTFNEYVATPPGATLDGVDMPADKVVTNGTVTAAVVDAFMSDYVFKVKKKSGRGAGTDLLSSKSVEAYRDALSDHRRDQIAKEPHRFETDEQRR